MGALRFILDGAVKEIERIDPTRTVLEHLRGVEGRCGTKEGCAEGDCGACTVVLGELHGGRLRFRAVNACLLFVPALDGKALFTVESLRGRDGELHPIQRAMVECHGSQCGFCTPGFVMSILALFESEPEPSRQRIDEALAGNLCRCTGYRPIVAAVHRAYALRRQRDGAARQALAAQLSSLARKETLAIEHEGRHFYAPRSLAAATELLERHPQAHLLAGGTDLGVTVTKGHRRLETVVYLGAVPELTGISRGATHLEIGAAACYTDVLEAVADHHPDLGALVRRIGSQQIRNLGTLGGNLATASPIGDTLPALVALGATVVVARRSGRRELPVEDLVVGYRKTALGPGELLERIRLPLARPGQAFRAYKVAKRFDQDISAVCGAFAIELGEGRVRDVRLCYGGMAPTPRRARASEAALVGRPFSEASIRAAAAALEADLAPISDLRASAGYRRLVAANLLRKFHAEVTGLPGATRVVEREDA
jgi:xanthine dehydrogenase small subunit